MTSMDDYEESFKICLQNGGTIQILLLDPRGSSAKVRTRGVKEKELNVERAVLDNFKNLAKIKPAKGRLEIKFYDEFPGVDMIACDQRIFCGWYLYQQLAKEGSYLELLNNDIYPLSQNINRNWNSLWNTAAPASKPRCPPPRPGWPNMG